MKTSYQFYVYIMASQSGVLYIGFTNSLIRRVYEHRQGQVDSFTHKYKVHKLVYYECFCLAEDGIRREKQLKKWSRAKKLKLIHTVNPTLSDWTEEWD